MEAPDDSSGDPEREGVIEDALRSTSLAILRSLTFAGSAFLFGFPVFVLLVLRPSLTERSETDLGGARHASGRRAEELLRSALVATLTAAILTLLLQATLIAQVRGGELGWSSISSVLGTSFGTWSAVRVPILAGLAVLVVGRTRTALVTDPGGTWWAMWVVVAGFLLLTISEAGHAGVVSPPWSLVNDVVHLASAGTWFAGVVSLAVILPRAVREPGGAALIAPSVIRFSRVAFVSITLAAITGTINSILDVGGFGELWSTGYGRTLVLKIGVFIGILALGALNHFVIRDRIAKESSAAEGDGARARATFRKTIVFEVALALAVLGLTAILTGLAPPGDRPAAVAPEGPNSRTAAPSPTYFLQ